MSSLASWIDAGAVAELARDLCPEDDGLDRLPSVGSIGAAGTYFRDGGAGRPRAEGAPGRRRRVSPRRGGQPGAR